MLVRWECLAGADAGFTGTRHLISSPQRAVLMSFLIARRPGRVHYGDCTGADYEMFLMSHALGIKTVSHPPENDLYRMFTLADEVRDPKPYLERNRDIVDSSDYLVACPREDREVSRSGTWMTVRYARSAGLTVAVVYPSGRVDFQQPAS